MEDNFNTIDLSHFSLNDPDPPEEAFSKNPVEVDPAKEMGFRLTGMQPNKVQSAVGVPPSGKRLHGVLWGYGLATFDEWDLPRMAAEDRLHLGGITASLSQERINDYGEDIIRRPEIRTQVSLSRFPKPPAVELVYTVSSYFWSPEDSWVQFFIGRDLIGRIFIGGRGEEKTFRIGFRLLNVPNGYFMVHSRLATEVENLGHVLFDEVALKVME